MLEGCPPLAVIRLAREERNHVIHTLGVQAPPPRSFWGHRRLSNDDEWFLEVAHAVNGHKKRFFTQLVVQVRHCRVDLYVVDKVSSITSLSLKQCTFPIYHFDVPFCNMVYQARHELPGIIA